MSDFTIVETVYTTVDADTAQQALDAWLNAGNDVAKAVAVENRHVEDEHGRRCEVHDQ